MSPFRKAILTAFEDERKRIEQFELEQSKGTGRYQDTLNRLITVKLYIERLHRQRCEIAVTVPLQEPPSVLAI